MKVEATRPFKKDGSVLESKSEGERNLSEPWYGLFYDVRARVIAFPQMEPGDVLELVTRTDDSGSNFFADYFGDWALSASPPQARRISDYVLLGPAGRTFYASATPPQGRSCTTQGKAPGRQHLAALDRAPEVPKLHTPAFHARLQRDAGLRARLHLQGPGTTSAASTGAWSRTSSTSPTTSDAAGAGSGQGHRPGATSRRAIRAVYDFVVSPAPATSAWSSASTPSSPTRWRPILSAASATARTRRRLMHAMLESLGIDSRLTLLRMKRLGGIAEAARLAWRSSTTPLLDVPKYKLFLDGTAEFHGSGRAARRRPRRGSAGGGARGRLEVLPHAGSEAPPSNSRRDAASRQEPVARRQRQR